MLRLDLLHRIPNYTSLFRPPSMTSRLALTRRVQLAFRRGSAPLLLRLVPLVVHLPAWLRQILAAARTPRRQTLAMGSGSGCRCCSAHEHLRMHPQRPRPPPRLPLLLIHYYIGYLHDDYYVFLVYDLCFPLLLHGCGFTAPQQQWWSQSYVYCQLDSSWLGMNSKCSIKVEIHDGPYNVIKNWNYTGLVEAIHNAEAKCWTAKVIPLSLQPRYSTVLCQLFALSTVFIQYT
ncbi:hypothetical protein QYE76_033510 [Lolium multiflorum]|uniref:Uncharacterized protein n=1 Tax=Lolium multiflorum TaxID=4521 RepID=A0AAD8QXJ4_LOLMU|nr:hypothetical protein QYE76_033510 [Lolium multiflorum]